MFLTQRLEAARTRRRLDTDPDLCQLQTLWVQTYGSEHGLLPVLREFQNNPSATLDVYIDRYIRSPRRSA